MTGVLLGIHLLVWAVLAAYGIHRLHLLRLRRSGSRAVCPPPRPLEWPSVTVQLPVFNERYVVRRLIRAAAAMDYPRDRLEIQVLDDSTDETSAIAADEVRELRSRGIDAAHLRRSTRDGFKAGALQHGLHRAKGDLLAVFDADFLPPPSFLRATAPYFEDPSIGVVQARWSHLNPDYSLLARAQALSLDGHFLVEHVSRASNGRFINFNGTAGILRKACVLDAGGWQWDTLTEDLDLSYRAQLKGWRFAFAPHVGCPAELPVEMNGFKAQQYRWVKGSIQVARKMLPAIWRAPLPLALKLEATFHLTGNVAYALVLVLALIAYPVVLARQESPSALFTVVDTALFLIATLSVLVYFAAGQRAAGPDWRRPLRHLPFLFALGLGLAANNARAVLTGVIGRSGHFQRTPKFAISGPGDGWRGKRYRTGVNPWVLLELALGAYLAWSMVALARAGIVLPVPFLIVYAFGFLYVGVMSVVHAARRA